MTQLQIQETAITTIEALLHTTSNYNQIERQIIYQIHSHSHISTKEDFIEILHLIFENIIICPKCQKICNKYETLNSLCLHCLTNL